MALRTAVFSGLLSALLIFSPLLRAETGGGDSPPMFEPRESLVGALYDYDLTGDPNYDYARIMVPMNIRAIAMIDTLLDHSEDERLLRVAGLMKDEIAAELEALQEWQARFSEPTPGDNAEAVKVAIKGVRDRMMEHRDEMEASQETGTAFAAAMVWYHEVAISLTQVTLDYSVDAQLRMLASDIRRDHTRQIAELRNWESLR